MRRLGGMLAVVLCGCSGSTQAVIDISLAAGAAAPASIEVYVYDAHGTRASKSFPGSGLPGKVVLRLDSGGESLRIAVAGAAPSTLLGSTAIETQSNQEVRAAITLAEGTPDRDGDKVPDNIDNCADTPNRGQENGDGVGGGDACGSGDGGFTPDLFGVDGGLRINALHPEIAQAGDTVFIEGNFLTGARVDFPGGAGVTPDDLTETRVQVKVPTGATAGPLRVSLGTLGSNELPFRRASFPLSLQAFRVEDEQPRIARYANRHAYTNGEAAVVARGRLFSFGALIDNRVEAARIDADGNLGQYQLVGRLTHNRSRPTATLIGDRIYVVSGFRNDMNQNTPDVEHAVVHPDGSIDPFVPSGINLITARRGHAALVIGKWLYVIAGDGSSDGTQPLDSLERAEILQDGSLGPFQLAGTLLRKREGGRAAVVGNWLYVFGGYSSGSYHEQVERALIKADGTLDSFADIATPWTQARMEFAVAQVGSRVYVVGGYESGSRLSDVLSAPITPSGELGPFGVLPGALTVARNAHSAVVIENRLWAIGGAPDDSDEHASLVGTAKLGPSTATGLQAPALADTDMVVLGRWAYSLGGETMNSMPVTEIHRAPIAADGTLGAFAPAGITLTKTRLAGGVLVLGDRLYVISGGNTRTDSESAPIGADGTLGTFVAATATVPAARSSGVWVARGDYVYALGGGNGAGRVTTVDRAQIDASGVLGNFTTQAGPTIADGRPGLSAALFGSELYLYGGIDAAGNTNDFGAHGTIAGDGTLSALTVMPGGNHSWGASVMIGTYLYMCGGVYSKNIERSTVSPAGVPGALTGTSTNHSGERWDHSALELGNYVYFIGGRPSDTTLMSNIERAEIVP